MSGTVYRSRKGPRVGSLAYLALRQLHKDGGRASMTVWMKSTDWRASLHSFNQEIVGTLLGFQLIAQRGLQLALTDAGREFLGDPPPAAPSALPSITPPPYVAPMRPLARRPTVGVIREGAFDYRDIPSLHFGTSVPFKSHIKLENEASNG